MLENNTHDLLALSGAEKKLWLRAVATARLVGKNKRKRKTTTGIRGIIQSINQNEEVFKKKETDNQRKQQRKWDNCSQIQVRKK